MAAVVVAAVAGALLGRFMRPVLADNGAPMGRAPVPEVMTAGLFALAAWRVDGWPLVAVLVLMATLAVLSIVDLVDYRLPDAVLFPGTAAGAAVLIVGELVDGAAANLAAAAVGAVVYFVILLVMHLVSPAGMGFGDVKLAVLLGMYVGWAAGTRLDAVRGVMMALLVGSLLGVMLGVGRIAAVRLGARFLPDPEEGSAGPGWHRTTFPFGPPLMIGALAVVLFPTTFLG